MAGRVIPVRERVTTAVQRQLLTIQRDNGYQFSLTSVHRRPGDVWRATNPPEAYLYFGRTRFGFRTGSGEETTGTQDRLYVGLMMQVRAFASAPEEDCDREGNLLLSDIQKALCTVHQPIKDPFYTHGDIYVRPQSAVVGYPWTDSGYVVVVSFHELQFWHKASEPALWDSDDTIVHEEQLVQGSYP